VSTLPTLLRQRLHRDRLQLPLWILGTAGLALLAATSIADTYGDDAERAAILRLAIANPTILVFRGTPNGAGLGEFTFFQIFTFLALMGGLMSTFLAVRHTRAEEELGRAELIASTPAGRVRPTIATLLHGLVANVVLGLLTAAAFAAGGLAAHGSLVAGAAMTVVGLAFLSFGLLAAQLFRTSRSANSASVAFVVGAYVLRGIGDAGGSPTDDPARMTPAWPSWLSPIGWGQRTGAFGANDLTPLLLPIGFAVVLTVLVFSLQSLRDEGASLVAGRPGRASAGPSLSSPFGLAWRLNASTILWWTVGGAVTGMLTASLVQAVGQIGDDVPEIAATLHQSLGAGASLQQALIATLFGIVGVLASCCAVQIAIRARQEEARGSAELVLTTPVSQLRWVLAFLAVGVLGVTLVIAAGVLFGVLGALGGASASAVITDIVDTAAGQFAPAFAYLALTLLLFAFVPRATIALGWTLVGLGAVLGIFGDLVGLPEWAVNLSPFSHSPVLAGDSVDWSGGAWMLAIAAALAALAVFRRRELAAGG
jgi:ABC-2 type transport system permease protein